MSMLRNLATSLVNSEKEHIVTTLPKAKELRPFVEKAITLARKAQAADGDGAQLREVHLRRQAARFFHAGNSTFKEADDSAAAAYIGISPFDGFGVVIPSPVT